MIYAQLSCSMTRDPRMIAAGWQARAVYVEAILYCRENLTDGIIDRLAMPYWMPDMPVKARVKLLDRLVEVSALDACDQGWRFPEHVWGRWNPSKADVESKREAEAQRKADYRARRRSGTEPSEDVPTGHLVLATSRDRQPESEPEPEPKPEPKPKNHHRLSTTPVAPVEPVDKFDQVVEQILTLRAARSKPTNPNGWAHTVRASIRGFNTERINELLDKYPDAPYDVIAAAVEGDNASLSYFQPKEQTA
jgi:hypothetical protein